MGAVGIIVVARWIPKADTRLTSHARSGERVACDRLVVIAFEQPLILSARPFARAWDCEPKRLLLRAILGIIHPIRGRSSCETKRSTENTKVL